MISPAKRFLFGAFALGLAGCATSFTGDAKFPGGERGCFDKCAASGMTMAAFVYMGEYSTGCVCQPKALGPSGPGAPAANAGASSDGKSARMVPGVLPSGALVGVVMQMRAQQEQQQRASMMGH